MLRASDVVSASLGDTGPGQTRTEEMVEQQGKDISNFKV